MSTLSKDLVLLILQFLDEEGFKEAARVLERESGCFFNMKFFEDMILGGNWDEAERYLSAFTKLDDNRYSTKIYFEIRKQNFLEALDSKDHAKALEVLMKDLKVFDPDHEELFKEMTLLLTLNDIRDHESLSMYIDTESARKVMMDEIRKVVEANPLLRGKLEFPHIKSQRLRRLINQSLNWQHMHCAYPQPNPDIRTLFVDHVCVPIPSDNHLFAASNDKNPLPSQTTSMPVPTFPASKCTPSSVETHSSVSSEACSPGGSTSRAPTKDGLEDDTHANCNSSPKKVITISKRPTDEEIPSACYPDQSSINISDDLPKSVAIILCEGSSPKSIDFHPVQQTVLLVGTIVGSIALWEVSSGKNLLSRSFKVWDIGACSMMFQATWLKDPHISVNRVAWSPEGSLFGVAYSEHIVQLYSYKDPIEVQQQLEIDAHVGRVNDLAFSAPEKQLLVITCGDDKTVKAWDATCGVKMYTFEGHDAPVYSICTHSKGNIHFIFSTSVNGNIKVWLYDNLGARVDYDAPGLGCTSMAYSSDRRLFSCGTSKNGESYLVEWDESEGSIKRTYQGLQKNSSCMVQFDVMKNKFLAAGNGHAIKIWEMNKTELFATIDAEGGLPANPFVRFNKEGTLLAVSANDNRIKILATNSGLQLLHLSDEGSDGASKVLSDTLKKLAIEPFSTVDCAGVADEAVAKDVNSESLQIVKSKIVEKSTTANSGKLFEINSHSQCQMLQLPSHVKVNKISRLIYNNAGNSILALTSNGTHLYWKWHSDKVTTQVLPQLWQPRNSLGLLKNDLTGSNPEVPVSCFTLSKNDSYLMSASGGRISLFNLVSFKTMMSIMPPPPAATCLAFHPLDNNILAIGRDTCTILIFNVRVAKLVRKLKGHSQRVSGLAFSNHLKVLVSAGADAQITVWNVDGWDIQRSRSLQVPDSKMLLSLSDTHIQFHKDQTHFLAVHETHLSVYEARTLECVKQWIPGDFAAPISHATFSCDSLMVFSSFVDGSISIFDASDFRLHCRITPTAYLLPTPSLEVYPIVIAAHPQKPNQFAVGLTDGVAVVFEPQNSTGKWTTSAEDENESTSQIPAESEVDH